MRSMTTSGRDRAHDVVVEAELLEHLRREVLDDDVGARDESLREGEAVGVTEVERDPALAEIRRVEQRRLLVELRILRRGRNAALKRIPSGRCTASTLITSAPIAASHAVRTVRPRTR